MGLPSTEDVAKTARLPKIKSAKNLREPGKSPGSFCWNLIIYTFDKGKPVERQGRKAMGLPSCLAGSGLPGCRKRITEFAN